MYIRRKVYSDFADYDYSYDEPQLYSVTMDEEELALFSEFEDAYYEALYSDKGDASGAVGTLAGLGVAGTAAGVGYANRHKIAAKIRSNVAKDKKAANKAFDAAEAAIKDKFHPVSEGGKLSLKNAYKDYVENTKTTGQKLVGGRKMTEAEWLKKMENDAMAEARGAKRAAKLKAGGTSARLANWAKKNPMVATAYAAGAAGALGLGGYAAGKALGAND